MRTWLKWLLAVMTVFVLIIVTVYVYIFHLGGLENYVLREVNAAIAQPGNLKVYLDRIEGDFLSDLTVHGLRIEYTDSARAFTLVRVERLSAEYALMDLLRGEMDFESVALKGLDLTIGHVQADGPVASSSRSPTAGS